MLKKTLTGKLVYYVNKLFTKEEETANKYLKISQSYLYSSKLSQKFFYHILF